MQSKNKTTFYSNRIELSTLKKKKKNDARNSKQGRECRSKPGMGGCTHVHIRTCTCMYKGLLYSHFVCHVFVCYMCMHTMHRGSCVCS